MPLIRNTCGHLELPLLILYHTYNTTYVDTNVYILKFTNNMKINNTYFIMKTITPPITIITMKQMANRIAKTTRTVVSKIHTHNTHYNVPYYKHCITLDDAMLIFAILVIITTPISLGLYGIL